MSASRLLYLVAVALFAVAFVIVVAKLSWNDHAFAYAGLVAVAAGLYRPGEPTG